MAYPTVSAPYGLKPINLIGGQVFAGSTRNLPIQYGYATNIGYGDFVTLSRGTVGRLSVTSSAGAGNVGIFLGCSYTSPATKQKLFSQYWPGGTLAGDAVAIVTDDPDTLFKAVVCSSGVVVASSSIPVVGQNIQMIDNGMSTSTGNSLGAVAGVTATPATTGTFPLRVVGVVPDTAYSASGIGSSASTTITLTAGLSSAILAGADVAYIAPNGQLVETGSFVTAGYVAGATSITINQAIAVPGGITAIPGGSTIVFTNYPEVLVKINFGQHAYYTATASA